MTNTRCLYSTLAHARLQSTAPASIFATTTPRVCWMASGQGPGGGITSIPVTMLGHIALVVFCRGDFSSNARVRHPFGTIILCRCAGHGLAD